MGRPLLPWQRVVADVAGEVRPDGRPYYRDVIVSVPRQSGKTLLMWAFAADRGVSSWPGGPRQTVAWTAQTGSDGRKKWIKDLLPMTRESLLSAAVKKITEGMGNESVEWLSGSTINLLSTNAGSGHSLTLDLVVLDELWADSDDRREQALRPAMATKPAAQMWSVSTMGTGASTAWNRKRDLGRAAAEDDPGSGVCYFEWSCLPDRWDPDDPESWAEFMPALGHTIDVDTVQADLAVMDPEEAKRSFGNITVTAGGDRLIPPEYWHRVSSREHEVSGRSRGFGVAVSEDLSVGAVAVADTDGNVELVEHRPGTGWIGPRVEELVARWGGRVAFDSGGPAASLGLPGGGELKGREYVKACQSFYLGVIESTLSVRSDPAFDEAVEGAVRKQIGDAFVWSRRSSTADVSPVEAASCAVAAARGSAPVEYTYAAL